MCNKYIYLLCGFQSTNSDRFSGDGYEDPPVPISNTEVKLQHAKSSWGIAPCEDRTLPRCYGGLAQLGERLPYKQRVTGSSPVSSI